MIQAEQDHVLYVGVDGGGSRCRVRVRDASGQQRGAIEGGTANVYLDFETATRNIRDSIAAALAQAATTWGRPAAIHIGLGLAGVSGPAVAERVRATLAPLGTVMVTHDGDIACIGAHAGADGGLIIAGTGSVGVARIGGRSTTIGGRGFIMGDDGSGARLGQEALRRALRAFDGLEAATPLSHALMAQFGNDPVRLIEWARTARSSEFGTYAPLVVTAAHDDDPIGRSTVETAAAAIADLADALVRLGAPRLAMVGGLSAALRPFLPAATRDLLHDPILDPLDGALVLVECPVPRSTIPTAPGSPTPGRP